MNRPRIYVYLPIIFSIILILGILIGHSFKLQTNEGGVNFKESRNEYSKISEILNYIKNEYVDTVKINSLIDKSIVEMLKNLDPHSSYITADELAENDEPLKGKFEGIGIEFNIVDDTIRVIDAIADGPAEKVGVKSGDKIIYVDDKKVAGIKITNKIVMEKLKGKGGTKVKVGIKRNSKPSPLNFVITRGTIPIYSVDVSNMLTSKIGYIKISRFAATTYDEYLKAVNKLQTQGMQQLIIDLRGNGGGFLNTAVSLADEFLSEGKEIVYTMGRSRPRKDYKASSSGNFENGKLIILIDDASASASEILAGALQDNDRATIVGRRSFGKGLVQEQTEFADGSALRLTIARYYTPTGRCIQKSYKNGLEEYYDEEYNRLVNGELENKDSIKISDSIQYKTPAGKIVYGGGGIIPDIFVPIDTVGKTRYLNELFYSGLINDFAFAYADKERQTLLEFKTIKNYLYKFSVSDKMIDELVVYAERNKLKRQDNEIKISNKIIKTQLKALIARNVWNNDGYYSIKQTEDNVIKKAIELME